MWGAYAETVSQWMKRLRSTLRSFALYTNWDSLFLVDRASEIARELCHTVSILTEWNIGRCGIVGAQYPHRNGALGMKILQ